MGSIPAWGAEIPLAPEPKHQHIKQQQISNIERFLCMAPPSVCLLWKNVYLSP